MNQRDIDRFWSKVERTGGCWLWSGGLTTCGYGRMKIGGRQLRASRVSWVLAHGDIAMDQLVCHRCDTPACVNPNHLFLGSHAENMRDMAAKGRSTAGGRNPRARLDQRQVDEIRRLLIAGSPRRDLAQRFGVSLATVGFIATNRTWRGGVSSPVRAVA